MSGFSEGDIARINDAYSTWVELTDERLETYDPERDDIPEHIRRAFFGDGEDDFTERAVRYNLVEQPAAGTCPPPYSSILERTSVVAFQEIEPAAEASYLPTVRKVEFINPFEALGGVTLMMLTLTDKDALTPIIPEASVRQYRPDGLLLDQLLLARPFYSPDLTNNILHLAVTIKRLSADHKLVPIGFEDLQAMFSLQSDLESQ